MFEKMTLLRRFYRTVRVAYYDQNMKREHHRRWSDDHIVYLNISICTVGRAYDDEWEVRL